MKTPSVIPLRIFWGNFVWKYHKASLRRFLWKNFRQFIQKFFQKLIKTFFIFRNFIGFFLFFSFASFCLILVEISLESKVFLGEHTWAIPKEIPAAISFSIHFVFFYSSSGIFLKFFFGKSFCKSIGHFKDSWVNSSRNSFKILFGNFFWIFYRSFFSNTLSNCFGVSIKKSLETPRAVSMRMPSAISSANYLAIWGFFSNIFIIIFGNFHPFIR